MKRVVKIALVGAGTVGQGVIKILENNKAAIQERIGARFKLVLICDIKGRPSRDYAYTKNYKDIIKNPDIDIVVELIGGYEPARTIILDVLRSGKHVVTANKAVIAKYWNQVFGVARRQKKLLYFEAAVAGAVPVIQGLNEGLAANKIEKITGILNGTTNYILSEMTRQKVDFLAALNRARKAGFAEADPSFDIKGIDTANKLAILSSLAWGKWIKVEDISVKGIGDVSAVDVFFAKNYGYVIKLLGIAKRNKAGLEISVHPSLVPANSTFANVEKEYNAISIYGDSCGDIMFYGKGAGQLPAASAVVSDIIFLSRQIVNETAGKLPYVNFATEKDIQIISQEQVRSEFYLRFTALDRPGVLSKISGILGKNEVSIASVYQQEPLRRSRSGVPVIMLTHSTLQGNLDCALKEIDNLNMIASKTVAFSIEK
jgi:homoserine dehydrogenase